MLSINSASSYLGSAVPRPVDRASPAAATGAAGGARDRAAITPTRSAGPVGAVIGARSVFSRFSAEVQGLLVQMQDVSKNPAATTTTNTRQAAAAASTSATVAGAETGTADRQAAAAASAATSQAGTQDASRKPHGSKAPPASADVPPAPPGPPPARDSASAAPNREASDKDKGGSSATASASATASRADAGPAVPIAVPADVQRRRANEVSRTLLEVTRAYSQVSGKAAVTLMTV